MIPESRYIIYQTNTIKEALPQDQIHVNFDESFEV
jgi:hypothetical protein